MKNLRLKILAIIIPILIIALLTLGSMNYMQAKKLIQEDNKSELVKTAEDESNIKKNLIQRLFNKILYHTVFVDFYTTILYIRIL